NPRQVVSLDLSGREGISVDGDMGYVACKDAGASIGRPVTNGPGGRKIKGPVGVGSHSHDSPIYIEIPVGAVVSANQVHPISGHAAPGSVDIAYRVVVNAALVNSPTGAAKYNFVTV